MHDGDMTYPMGEPTFERPTLLSSCAQAATEAEARFRVSYPNSLPRVTRVIALDVAAQGLVAEASAMEWSGASFYTLGDHTIYSGPSDVALIGEGDLVGLSSLIEGSDVVVIVATTGKAATQGEVIGRLARQHGIMAVALIVAAQAVRHEVEPLAAALRPASGVLVISEGGSDYLIAMLSALRA